MSQLVFNPLGGIPQAHLRDAEDLDAIEQIDRARWAATSAPISQLFGDAALLKMVDTDHDGRIRVDEIRAARAWLFVRLSGRSGVATSSDTVRLADLDTSTPEGKRLQSLAQRLASRDGKSDALTLAQIQTYSAGYAANFPNGDGVIAPAHVADPDAATLLADVIAGTGGTPELGGGAGARPEDIDAWSARCAAVQAWRAKGVDDAAALYTLGDDTAALIGVVQALAPKVAQFFAQCALLRSDASTAARLQPSADELAALDVRDAAAIGAWLDRASLATPNAAGTLDLTGPVNPAFAGALATLRDVILPRVGHTGPLDAAGWDRALAATTPWLTWQADQPAGIDPATTDEVIARGLSEAPIAHLKELCAQDLAVADELQAFNDLEKLVVLQRGLLTLCNNFVSFHQLFNGAERSMLEMGTLVLDGRNLSLCTRVADVGAHKAIAAKSGLFVAYAKIQRTDAAGVVHTDQIGAAVTAGTRGGIDAGKRGVFYDREGQEWDALLTDVIVQPISVWEAMVAPVERLRAFIADKVGSMVASKASALETDANTAANTAAATPPAPGAAAPGNLMNMFLAGSVAFAAVGATLTYVVETIAANPLGLLFGLGGLLGGLMAVSGIIGWWRLRHRDLSTLLESSGWALNGRMHMSFEMGDQFTQRPALPSGSVIRLTADQKRAYLSLAVLVVLIAGISYWVFTHPEVIAAMTPEPAPPAEAAPADAAPPATPPA
jgi:hypothetical protein